MHPCIKDMLPLFLAHKAVVQNLANLQRALMFRWYCAAAESQNAKNVVSVMADHDLCQRKWDVFVQVSLAGHRIQWGTMACARWDMSNPPSWFTVFSP